ncbi:MAG: hypothetical protein R3C19_08020 [Planctomycetaceae bacterium]
METSNSRPVTATREKVVIHAAYPLWRKHILMAIARAKELQDAGSEVVLTYCDSRGGTCAVNFAGSPGTCFICRSCVTKSAAEAGLTTVPLKTPAAEESASPVSWTELRDLAEGVQSGVTSTFRQLPGDTSRNPIIRAIKKRYFQTTLGLLTSMKRVLQQRKPDRVEVFNGRQACSRFCLIAARSAGLPFNTLEITARQQPIIFRGHTAHDRRAIQKRVLSHPADVEAAEAYFARRRQPAHNKYAKKHASEFSPPDAGRFKKKISVFLSSQDEFESLGPDWRSPFPDYATVVEAACRRFPEYLFCIRFHPNQADIAGDITTPFRAIDALPNTVVYYPTDTANTYALLEWSDTVVTFGSTVTVEACWLRKPVIALGPSFYDQLNVSHNPQTMDEFLNMLGQDLPALDPTNAARLAVFAESDSDDMRYLDYNGRTIVPRGIHISRPWLSRIARTCDNVFCRLVKTSARLTTKYRRRAA